MEKGEKLWNKIKNAERKLLIATPEKAAKLTKKIVKWKGQVFDENLQ